MDNLIEKIFKFKKVNTKELLKYGFVEEGNKFYFHKNLTDFNMLLTVCVNKQSEISAEINDLETKEPYTLFLSESAVGAFVGNLRMEYEAILMDIACKCFDKEIFKRDYTKRLISYIREFYGGELEFLWDKFPDIAVVRRKDNRKWYGVIFAISKCKLGCDCDEIIEAIDLRMVAEDIERLVDNQKYFKGYHMNKKHWITISLEGDVSFEEIVKRTDESYKMAH